jgi:hypothetical protein
MGMLRSTKVAVQVLEEILLVAQAAHLEGASAALVAVEEDSVELGALERISPSMIYSRPLVDKLEREEDGADVARHFRRKKSLLATISKCRPAYLLWKQPRELRRRSLSHL